MPIDITPIKQTAADKATAAANNAVVLTYAAVPGLAHLLAGVTVSYSAAPTAGKLTIEDGSGTTVFEVDITAAGPTTIKFDTPLMGSVNTALIVTLAAAGGGVVGKVNCQHRPY